MIDAREKYRTLTSPAAPIDLANYRSNATGTNLFCNILKLRHVDRRAITCTCRRRLTKYVSLFTHFGEQLSNKVQQGSVSSLCDW